MADALKMKNNTLQKLYLHRSNIGDEGAKYIADMLAANKTLQMITLIKNNIGDQGAQSIATSLAVNTGIHAMYLQDNKITDVGGEKIAAALINNHSIQTLEVYGNKKMSKDVMDRIKALAHLDLKTRMLIANKVIVTTKRDEPNEPKSKALPNKRLRTEDTPMAKDEEITLLRAKLKALEVKSELTNKRHRAEDTSTHPKELTLRLGYEHTHCSITCHSKFSTDLDSKVENIRKHLPVLSSSKTCDHYFCHGCILKQQLELAEKSGRFRKWIPCMICRTNTAFCPSEPKYHRLLIGIS